MSRGKKKAISLQEWIREMGRHRVSAELGVSDRTVDYWINRAVYPRVESMLKMIDLSKGRLTLESIVNSTCPRIKESEELRRAVNA